MKATVIMAITAAVKRMTALRQVKYLVLKAKLEATRLFFHTHSDLRQNALIAC